MFTKGFDDATGTMGKVGLTLACQEVRWKDVEDRQIVWEAILEDAKDLSDGDHRPGRSGTNEGEVSREELIHCGFKK